MNILLHENYSVMLFDLFILRNISYFSAEELSLLPVKRKNSSVWISSAAAFLFMNLLCHLSKNLYWTGLLVWPCATFLCTLLGLILNFVIALNIVIAFNNSIGFLWQCHLLEFKTLPVFPFLLFFYKHFDMYCFQVLVRLLRLVTVSCSTTLQTLMNNGCAASVDVVLLSAT